MKRKAFFLLLSFLVSFLNAGASELSLKLWGGGSRVDGGDLNRNISGWDSYFEDRNKAPYSFSYDVKRLQAVWGCGAELTWRPFTHLSFGLGLEFLRGAAEGEMASHMTEEQAYFNSSQDFGTIFIDEQSSQQPKYRIQSIPLTLTLYYFFTFGKKVNLFLGCGGGCYFGKMTYRENYSYDFDYTDEKNLSGSILEFIDQYSTSGSYSEEMSCKAFGFHAKGGCEFKIGGRLYFIVEAQGRKVGFNDWKGQKKDSYTWSHTWGYWGVFSDEDSAEEAGEGKLWMAEFVSDETGKSYPRFVFSEEKPLSPSYSRPRPAKINLSGLSLSLGIRISL